MIKMPSGGARNRSGPPPDPNSGRSDRRGLNLMALPSEGRKGRTPKFPLPEMRRFRWEYEEKRRFQVFDADSTEQYRERELELWTSLWRTPQACAWSGQQWRWNAIAEFCRLSAVVEAEPDANASLVTQLHRYRDQLGLTPAGLKENGWAIAADDVAAKRSEKAPAVRSDVKSRLAIAPDGTGG